MFKKSVFILVLHLNLPFVAQAQDSSSGPPTRLSEITVLGDLAKPSTYDFIPTVSEISGAALDRKRQPTLGETLGKEVGVSSSFFGPNASRPIIRGMDGERIRILNNGTGVLDASAASQDHGVAVDPFLIERVEIVRGAAALLYGSSAVGGVVNVITNRILERSPEGLELKLDTRHTSVDDGRSAALAANYGLGSWTFHVDGSSRDSNDYDIPGYARTEERRTNKPLDAESVEGFKYVPNSAAKTYNGAVGTSYLFDNGFAGVSYARYDSKYGTVAEQAVRIKMKQEKVDAAAGFKNLGWIESLRIKNSYSDYKHEEMEGDAVGTTFTNRGNETRLEMTHQKLGPWAGLFGLQSNLFDFAAIGDERFLPKTSNQNLAAFLFEEATFGPWSPSFGFRLDQYSVKAEETFVDVDPNNLGEASAGGPSSSKDFIGSSASLGTMYALNSEHSLVLNFAYTERAPNYQELFANGPHLATGAFERGNLFLEKEKSQSAEFSYRYKNPKTKGNFTVFLQDFKDYVSLSPKGGGGFDPEGAPGNRDLSFYQYEAVNARFYGAELEISHEFLNLLPSGSLELGAKFDTVRAKNESNGQNLPRITPMRESVHGLYKSERFSADLEIQHVEKQNDTAPNEIATDAYTMVNLGAEFPTAWNQTVVSFYGRVHNVFDENARNHVSFLKDVAPLPGRSFVVGLQAVY